MRIGPGPGLNRDQQQRGGRGQQREPGDALDEGLPVTVGSKLDSGDDDGERGEREEDAPQQPFVRPGGGGRGHGATVRVATIASTTPGPGLYLASSPRSFAIVGSFAG